MTDQDPITVPTSLLVEKINEAANLLEPTGSRWTAAVAADGPLVARASVTLNAEMALSLSAEDLGNTLLDAVANDMADLFLNGDTEQLEDDSLLSIRDGVHASNAAPLEIESIEIGPILSDGDEISYTLAVRFR